MSVRDDTTPMSDDQGPITAGLKRVVVASMAGTVADREDLAKAGVA